MGNMTDVRTPPRSLLSLFGVAMLIALVWRAEVELRGWDGLDWIGYWHVAIPVGGLMWLGWIARMMRGHRQFNEILGFAASWGIIAGFVLDTAARVYFSPWHALEFQMLTDAVTTMKTGRDTWMGLALAGWFLAIILLYGGFRFYFRFPWWVWPVGLGLWSGSWMLGSLVLQLVPDRGHTDLIHALKTGWMIPFCVIAVGLPVAWMTTNNTNSLKTAPPAAGLRRGD